MQIYSILLVVLLVAADGGFLAPAPDEAWPLLAIGCAFGGPLCCMLLARLGVMAALRGVSRGRGYAAVASGERMIRLAQFLTLPIHAAGLAAGWMALVRGVVGDLVLIDEILITLPPILGVVLSWWIWWPVEQRMRDWDTLARLDSGVPLRPTATRLRWTVLQARVHLFLLLVPVGLALGASEASQAGLAALSNRWSDLSLPDPAWAGMISVLVVFTLSPLVVRVILDTVAFPPGIVRHDLLEICARHRVRVRDLLVWRTGGTILNAAVVGLLPGLRYVLLTDAIVTTLPKAQLHAVMAHEVAHVRRRHMFIGTASLIAAAIIGSGLAEVASVTLNETIVEGLGGEEFLLGLGLVLSLLCVFVGFGWVSRRLERQADSFAVVDLSRENSATDGDGRISARAVEAMCGALEAVAPGGDFHRSRRSWRHGSIRWRQRYLSSLLGQRVDALAIDRLVRRIAIVSGLIALVGAARLLLSAA